MIMICVFPIIKSAIDSGLISVGTIAETLEESELYVVSRLSGKANFDINEAMKINVEFFPETPFKDLFTKSS